jgi:hypothetical protein
MRREEEKKIKETKLGNCRRSKIVPHRLMAQGALFCLFMGTSPKDSALLSGNGNTVITTKLKDKQTSIATVRDLLRTFATFPAPLLSHCRLPLSYCLITFFRPIVPHYLNGFEISIKFVF